MKSILSLAAVVLLGASNVAARADYPAAALVYRQYNTLVAEGCYSSSSGLSLNSSYTYNTKGYCQTQCVPMDKSVQATSAGNQCWCGDNMPPASSKVDNSFCNVTCTGYSPEICGGDGYFSVYLTGTTTTVPGPVSSSASSSTSPKTSATTSASPSVVTIGGQTVVVTAPAEQSSLNANAASSGSTTNKAAIAAGVVVGIVVIAAAAGGIFFFLRHRRRRAVEEEYRRNAAVSSFVNGGKAPSSAGGSSFDTRLEPSVMAQRRMSDGSIADNQDYSRRILKVTNA